jgi:hypothetical protein
LGGNTGDVGTVIIAVAGIIVIIGEVVLIDNAIGYAIIIIIGSK